MARRPKEKKPITASEVEVRLWECFDRITRTEDGQVLLAWLRNLVLPDRQAIMSVDPNKPADIGFIQGRAARTHQIVEDLTGASKKLANLRKDLEQNG